MKHIDHSTRNLLVMCALPYQTRHSWVLREHRLAPSHATRALYLATTLVHTKSTKQLKMARQYQFSTKDDLCHFISRITLLMRSLRISQMNMLYHRARF